jgi:hypothetical protein
MGTRYGRRTVIAAAAPNGWGQRVVEVRCDCGRVGLAALHLLRAGKCQQCQSCARRLTPAESPHEWATRGERCGYRAQCPADGHLSCRYYLPLHDLCGLTVADLGGVSAAVVADLTGVSRQAVLATVDRAGHSRRAAFAAIQAEGFEHPHPRVPLASPWWRVEGPRRSE